MFRLWTIACLVAILAALTGPACSYHFAQRQPLDAHLYMAQAALPHNHWYEAPHDRSASQDKTSDNQASCTLLPPGLATGVDTSAANSPLNQRSTSLLCQGESGLGLTAMRESNLPLETRVAPPTPPPRAAL